MFRKIEFPPMTMAQDRDMLRDGLTNAGVDMGKSGEWLDPLYKVLQEHIVSGCKGDKSIPDGSPTIQYFRVGPAVITDPNQLPEDVFKETGGFIVAMQDIWGSRNWIFPHITSAPKIDDNNDTISL